MVYQRLLKLALAPRIGRPDKVEEIGILEDLPGHVGIGGWESHLEIAYGLAVPLMGAVFDLEAQNRLGPAVL